MSRIFFFSLIRLSFSSSLTVTPKACFYTSEDGIGTLSSCEELTPDSSWKLALSDQPQQIIDGFGAAWTDATTYTLDTLKKEDQETLLKRLFTNEGIAMKFMRMTVGQSDLTPPSDGRWSFDESILPDPDLTKFSLTTPGERMLSWIMRMKDVADVLLLGSIWSPPGWMKQNNNLRWEYIDSYVNYIITYLQTYADNGVEVSAMTLQNEPLHSAAPAWTMKMDQVRACELALRDIFFLRNSYNSHVQSYAAILTNKTSEAIAAATFNTKIWAYDHNTDHPEYPQYVLDNTANGAVDAVAWHCYGGGFEGLAPFVEANPGVKQYMSECWLHSTTGEGFFDLPQFLLRPIQYGASGSLAWTLGGSVDLDVSYPGGCQQCTGLVQVDMKNATYTLTQDYYNLGQFSKYVEKGARYLPVSGSYVYDDNTGVEAVGFQNPDGSDVVVVLNKFGSNLALELDVGGGGSCVLRWRLGVSRH